MEVLPQNPGISEILNQTVTQSFLNKLKAFLGRDITF
jgi:hypothetical protein